MKNKFIGCSGFYYKHWRGDFYPEKLPVKKWFEFYESKFNTLEINNTFYRFPKPEMLQKWYDSSAEDFSFSIKVPKAITHFKKFNQTERMLDDFYLSVDQGLKKKATAILFQMHPKWAYTPERLVTICRQVDNSFHNVFEFRHISWWNENVYMSLREKNITFCSISHPDLPNELIQTSENVYIRFHGSPKLYVSSYSNDELNEWVKQLKALKKINQLFVYFNNDSLGAAFKNAAYLNDEL